MGKGHTWAWALDKVGVGDFAEVGLQELDGFRTQVRQAEGTDTPAVACGSQWVAGSGPKGLAVWQSMLRYLAAPFPLWLPAKEAGKQQRLAQGLKFLDPRERPGGGFWLLAQTHSFSHLRSEPMDGMFLSFSHFHKKEKDLFIFI